MADLSDVSQILGDLDEYQKNIEANRNLLSKRYYKTTSDKKEHKYYYQGTQYGYFGTDDEFDQFIDDNFEGQYVTKPQSETKADVIKFRDFTDSRTDATSQIAYTDRAVNNYIESNPGSTFDDFFKAHQQKQGVVGAYSANQLSETEQFLFKLKNDLNKSGKEVSPITQAEAKLYIDINTILEDYADYTQDDMILGEANVKNRLKQVMNIFDQFTDGYTNNNLTTSDVNFLSEKLDEVEETFTQVKKDKMEATKVDGVPLSGFDKRTVDKNVIDLATDRFGKEVFLYSDQEGNKKIAMKGANEMEGSPIFGWTPVTKLGTDNLSDAMSTYNLAAAGAKQYKMEKKFTPPDKIQVDRYEKMMDFYMNKIATITIQDRDGTLKVLPMVEFLDLNDEERAEVLDKVPEKTKKDMKNAIATYEDNTGETMLNILSNYDGFKKLHKRWGFLYDIVGEGDEAKIPFPDWFKKKYPMTEQVTEIPEYLTIGDWYKEKESDDAEVDPADPFGVVGMTTPDKATNTFGRLNLIIEPESGPVSSPVTTDNKIDVDGIMYTIPPQFKNLNTDPQVKALFEKVIRNNPELAKKFMMGQPEE
tara:strand:+ start:302 stop:2068 length:1767 start_codon:yes stop_codon:yes gene_type:complete